MAERFKEFVLALGQDPQALRRFQDNPEEEMKAAGLTEAEMALLRSGDHALIGAALGSAPEGPHAMVVHLITVFERAAQRRYGEQPRTNASKRERFTEFVLALGQDTQVLRRFQDNPEEEMEAAGLTEAEKALLRSGDHALIEAAIHPRVPGDADNASGPAPWGRSDHRMHSNDPR
jgi:hypothetical protein